PSSCSNLPVARARKHKMRTSSHEIFSSTWRRFCSLETPPKPNRRNPTRMEQLLASPGFRRGAARRAPHRWFVIWHQVCAIEPMNLSEYRAGLRFLRPWLLLAELGADNPALQ